MKGVGECGRREEGGRAPLHACVRRHVIPLHVHTTHSSAYDAASPTPRPLYIYTHIHTNRKHKRVGPTARCCPATSPSTRQ